MSRSYLLSMNSIKTKHLKRAAVLCTSMLFWAPTAGALQPLNSFVEAARADSFDARELDATFEQRSWEARAALGRLLPTLSARGMFTHNQYKAVLPPGTFPGQTEEVAITPQNQFDGIFQLDVPLLDLAQHGRYAQAKHLQRASDAQREAGDSNLDRAVAQAYFTYVGASALVEAAEKSLASAEDNLSYVSQRNALGAATDLDQERARSNVERSKQDVADAQLIVLSSARNLQTLTGLSPSPVEAYPVDDLHHEAPLSSWLQNKNTPTDRVQNELTLAARAAKRSANHALLPTLSANAQQRITNATGFTGQVSSYTLQAVLSWRLDYSTYSTARAQSAAAEVQRIQAERARRAVEDTIFDAYHRVETSIVKSASARAQAEAADKAARLAQERYKVGAVTQLDVTQSQREAFQAQATRVKADADLVLARVMLRAASGLPITDVESTPANTLSQPAPPQDPPAQK